MAAEQFDAQIICYLAKAHGADDDLAIEVLQRVREFFKGEKRTAELAGRVDWYVSGYVKNHTAKDPEQGEGRLLSSS